MNREFVENVLDIAIFAGRQAADAKERELDAAGPRYEVFSADLNDQPIPNTPRYPMVQLCGFAWIHLLDGRAPEIKYLKAISDDQGWTSGRGHIRLYKTYDGTGFDLYLPVYDGQGIDSKRAGYEAALQVLKARGFGGTKEPYVSSRLD